MDNNIIAIIFQEGGRFLTEMLRTRRREVKVKPSSVSIEEVTTEIPASPRSSLESPPVNKASDIATGCVPCAVGHFSTCSGVISESLRFGRQEGLGSPEVLDRVGMCLAELNAMERVDLRPEMMVELPEWEKAIANQALEESRKTRHALEGLESVDQLEAVAANLQMKQKEIFRTWMRERLKMMSPEQKAEVQKKVMEKLEKGE